MTSPSESHSDIVLCEKEVYDNRQQRPFETKETINVDFEMSEKFFPLSVEQDSQTRDLIQEIDQNNVLYDNYTTVTSSYLPSLESNINIHELAEYINNSSIEISNTNESVSDNYPEALHIITTSLESSFINDSTSPASAFDAIANTPIMVTPNNNSSLSSINNGSTTSIIDYTRPLLTFDNISVSTTNEIDSVVMSNNEINPAMPIILNDSVVSTNSGSSHVISENTRNSPVITPNSGSSPAIESNPTLTENTDVNPVIANVNKDCSTIKPMIETISFIAVAAKDDPAVAVTTENDHVIVASEPNPVVEIIGNESVTETINESNIPIKTTESNPVIETAKNNSDVVTTIENKPIIATLENNVFITTVENDPFIATVENDPFIAISSKKSPVESFINSDPFVITPIENDSIRSTVSKNSAEATTLHDTKKSNTVETLSQGPLIETTVVNEVTDSPTQSVSEPVKVKRIYKPRNPVSNRQLRMLDDAWSQTDQQLAETGKLRTRKRIISTAETSTNPIKKGRKPAGKKAVKEVVTGLVTDIKTTENVDTHQNTNLAQDIEPVQYLSPKQDIEVIQDIKTDDISIAQDMEAIQKTETIQSDEIIDIITESLPKEAPKKPFRKIRPKNYTYELVLESESAPINYITSSRLRSTGRNRKPSSTNESQDGIISSNNQNFTPLKTRDRRKKIISAKISSEQIDIIPSSDKETSNIKAAEKNEKIIPSNDKVSFDLKVAEKNEESNSITISEEQTDSILNINKEPFDSRVARKYEKSNSTIVFEGKIDLITSNEKEQSDLKVPEKNEDSSSINISEEGIDLITRNDNGSSNLKAPEKNEDSNSINISEEHFDLITTNDNGSSNLKTAENEKLNSINISNEKVEKVETITSNENKPSNLKAAKKIRGKSSTKISDEQADIIPNKNEKPQRLEKRGRKKKTIPTSISEKKIDSIPSNDKKHTNLIVAEKNGDSSSTNISNEQVDIIPIKHKNPQLLETRGRKRKIPIINNPTKLVEIGSCIDKKQFNLKTTEENRESDCIDISDDQDDFIPINKKKPRRLETRGRKKKIIPNHMSNEQANIIPSSRTAEKRELSNSEISDYEDDFYLDQDKHSSKRNKKVSIKPIGNQELSSSVQNENMSTKEKLSRPTIARSKSRAAKSKSSKETASIDTICIDTDDEVKETEIASNSMIEDKERIDEDNEIQMLLKSRVSKLVDADFRELIPAWLSKLPSEDQEELALLLPEPDRISKSNIQGIRPDFGLVASTHFYEAVEKWQDILFLGGFEKKEIESPVIVEDSRFKDENYEQNWGDRIKRKENDERKAFKDNSKVGKKTKGKGKA